MASGLSSPLGIIGIILIIIGIIMAVVGIILLIVNQNNEKPWFIWFLLIGGIVLGIIGGILLAIALSQSSRIASCLPPCPAPCPAPIVQATPVVQTAPIQYVQQVVRPPSPRPVVSYARQELVGRETLDPDPRTYIYETPQAAQKVYYEEQLPDGQVERGTGVYKGPNVRTYYTEDIGEHEVQTGIRPPVQTVRAVQRY